MKYSAAENDELNKSLTALIHRHQEVIELSESMVKLFKINIFWHFVSAALVICCVSVNFLLVSVGMY